MRVLLSAAKECEQVVLLRQSAESSGHLLTDDPGVADLILLLGHSSLEPELLLRHPHYLAHPDKCAVYSDDDRYLPLVPGIQCSARNDRHSRVGRVFSWCYIAAFGQFSNPYIEAKAESKTFLFSFQGGSTSILRKRLYRCNFNRPDVLVEDTSIFHNWTLDQADRAVRQRRYADTIAASHFVLCPRGAGTGSIRLFEVMRAGVAPVLISDAYPLPPHVPWDTFLLRVAERDIKRLPELIEPHLPESAERGRRAREAWVNHFAPDKQFDAIVGLAAAALRHGPPTEAAFRRMQPRMIVAFNARLKARGMLRSAVLKVLRFLHVRLPYRMRMP
jgi:hypothetical protein